MSVWEVLPVTLCAGVGRVLAVIVVEFGLMASEEFAGDTCEGLWGVRGWNDMMEMPSNQGGVMIV